MRSMIMLMALLTISACAVIEVPDNLELSHHNLLLAEMKSTEQYPFEANSEALLFYFETDQYFFYKNNELKYQEVQQQNIKAIKENLKNMDLNQTFLGHIRAEFGNYDRKSKAFPFSPLTGITLMAYSEDPISLHFYRNNFTLFDLYSGALPKEYYIKFTNPQILKSIPMELERAEIFISNRTNGNDKIGNNINRSLNAAVTFRIKSFKKKGNIFYAEIQQVDVLACDNCSPIHSVALKNYKPRTKKVGYKSAIPGVQFTSRGDVYSD